MMRRTSSEAFEKIHQNGLLRRMQLRVYRALYYHGPLTGTELNFVLKGSKEASPSYHKRLSELLRQGVAVAIGTRKCSVTGQTVTIWDVTSDLPCLPESKKPGKGTAAAVMSLNAKLVKALEAQNVVSQLWKEIEIRDRRIEALEASLRKALTIRVLDMGALVAKAEAVGK